MNILPLIITSLLILACISNSFLRERKSTFWEERCYLGQMNAERKARAKIVSAHYKKAKENPATKKSSTPSTTVSYVNHRERNELTELSKINITSLFSSKSPELYEITARLIKELYGSTSFYTKDLEYTILDGIIKTAQKNKKAQQIQDFFPEDPLLATPFYKMAKGTHGSYPPLGDYLVIDRNLEKKPINFSYASVPLLSAAFGEKAARVIVEEEFKKWEKDNKLHRLDEKELPVLLEKIREKPFDYIKIQDMLNFNVKFVAKKQVVAVDSPTQIHVTKPL